MATIEKRGDSYRIVVSNGYDITGKQLRARMTWTPEPGMTKRQAEKELGIQAALFEDRCRRGLYINSSIRFADFANVWMEKHAKKQLRKKTISGYRDMLPRINAALGNIRLDRLQPYQLMSFYDNLEESGIRLDTKYQCMVDFKALLKGRKLTKAALAEAAKISMCPLNSITQGKSISRRSAEKISAALGEPPDALFEPLDEDKVLSGKTVRNHHLLISSILSSAVEWQIIRDNPCNRVKAPKVGNPSPKYLDEVQARQLLDLLEDAPMRYRTAVQVLLFTGLRRGELCGLEWQDIDFEREIIHVMRTSQYLPELGVFEDDTKTETSQRVAKVPRIVMDILRDYKSWQAEQRLQVGDQWLDTQRLFTNWNGAPIHPDTLTNWFHKFVQRNNLPPISIHSLRHTNATLMISSGTPVTTVARRLGHASPSTTMKIYAHAIQSADAAAAETLQDILAPTANRRHLG